MYKFILLLISFNLYALEVPSLTQPVMDLTGSISEETKVNLGNQARVLYEKDIAQVSFLIIPSLENEVLEDYSIRVANTWKLGNKKNENGLLVFISMAERKIRIEVGSGLEGLVTDINSNRMIQEMKPFMRSGDLEGAMLSVLNEVDRLHDYNSTDKVLERKLMQAERDRSNAETLAYAEKIVKNLFLLFLIGYLCHQSINYFLIKDPSHNISKEVEKKRDELKVVDKDLEEIIKKDSSLNYDKEKQKLSNLKNKQSEDGFRLSELKFEVSKMKKFIKDNKGDS
jgi:uncharacterized membrane protein YgcG